MFVIPFIGRSHFSGQPTVPGRTGCDFGNMPAQDNRQAREGEANRNIFPYVFRVICDRHIDFQIRILIGFVQIRHDTEIGQMNIRHGKERHFTGDPSQLMCGILSEASQHICQRLATNPQGQQVFTGFQPFRNIEFKGSHSSHV